MTTIPAWQYNEFQQVGTDYTSPDEIAVYDARMGKFRNLAQEMETVRRAIQLQPHHVLLEIGTGTGELPRHLAGECQRIIALDISQEMLNAARRKAEEKGWDNVQFVQAGFLTYEHQGEPVDAVVSQMALHHLPDFWKWIALRKIYDCLRPGGRFFLRDVVFSSEVMDYTAFLDGVVQGMRAAMDDRLGEDMARHIRQEYSTLDWILEGMLQRTGFTFVEKNIQHGFIGTYVCAK